MKYPSTFIKSLLLRIVFNNININSTLRQQLKESVIINNNFNVSIDLYELCAKEIRSLLMTNQWKTFITSAAYVRCAIILQRNLDVTRAIHHVEEEGRAIAAKKTTDDDNNGNGNGNGVDVVAAGDAAEQRDERSLFSQRENHDASLLRNDNNQSR